MTVLESSVTWVLSEFAERIGDPYVYGGDFSPTVLSQGCDCSYVGGWVLEALVNTPASMSWAHVVSTESWPFDYTTNTPAAPGTAGPYGTIAVASLSDIPADAALTINIMHGGGGEDSHMNVVLGSTILESNGTAGVCTNGNGGTLSTDPEWTDHWYLPGPISGAPLTYTVQTGDTLSSIATQLNLTVDELVSYNPNLITVGEVLNTAAPIPPPVPVPTPPAPPVPIATTTLFYPDVSNNQWSSDQDLTNFLSQLHSEGFAGVCHKVSEGNYYSDPYWQTCRSWCESNDLSWLGYHYVTTDDADSQAAQWNSNNGGPFAMLDFEQGGGDLDNFWDVVNAFNAAGINVTLAYIPNWYLNSPTGGGGDLSDLAANGIGLVSSAYPAGTGYASVIYQNAGGNTGTGWAAYNGGTPVVWQFTNQATVAGLSVDCNAYVGPDTTLDVLFTTGS